MFNNNVAGCTSKHMSFKHYEYVNTNVSSEMFYSLMAILHERLPCAKGFFRMKKRFRDGHQREGQESSPIRRIASPKMIRGLSITKKDRKLGGGAGDTISDIGGQSSPKRISSPEIRIKNLRQQQDPRLRSHGDHFFNPP